jgi:hypothetical protein
MHLTGKRQWKSIDLITDLNPLRVMNIVLAEWLVTLSVLTDGTGSNPVEGNVCMIIIVIRFR